jgi:prevent-host-death family protein
MSGRQPTTQTMKASEARQQFASVLNRVFRKEARVIVEKSGIPVAAIVSAEDLRRLDEFERERAKRFAIIDEVREAFRDVPPEEIERETDRILAEIRAEDERRANVVAATR